MAITLVRNHGMPSVCRSNCLRKKFIDEFRDNKKMDLITFGNKVQREFKIRPHRVKLGRARKAALDLIHGDEDAQYCQLWNYGRELRRSNPGSTFLLGTTPIKEKKMRSQRIICHHCIGHMMLAREAS